MFLMFILLKASQSDCCVVNNGQSVALSTTKHYQRVGNVQVEDALCILHEFQYKGINTRRLPLTSSVSLIEDQRQPLDTRVSQEMMKGRRNRDGKMKRTESIF